MKTFYDLFFSDFAAILSEFSNQYLPRLGRDTKNKNWWEAYVDPYLSPFQKRSLPVNPGLGDLDIAALLKVSIQNWDPIIRRYFHYDDAFGIKVCLLDLKKARNSISHMKAGSPITNDVLFRYLDSMDRISGLICPKNGEMRENCCKLKLHFIPQLQLDLMNELAALGDPGSESDEGPGTRTNNSATIIIENRHYLELEGILLPKLKKETFEKIGLKSWTLKVDENGSPVFAGSTGTLFSPQKTLSLQGHAKAPTDLMIDFHNGKGCHALPQIPCRIQTMSNDTFKLFDINIDQFHAFLPVQEKHTWPLSKNEMIIGRANTDYPDTQQAYIRLDFLHHTESLVWEENKEQYGVSLNMLELSRRHVQISNHDGEWYLKRLCAPDTPIYVHMKENEWMPLSHSTKHGQSLEPKDKFIVGYYMLSFKNGY